LTAEDERGTEAIYIGSALPNEHPSFDFSEGPGASFHNCRIDALIRKQLFY